MWEPTKPAGGGILAFAVLGGMVAWTLHLGASYAVVPFVCETGHEALLHLLTGAAVVVAAGAIAAGGWAWWSTRGAGEDPHLGVRRFLAVAGLLLSAYFLLLIVMQGLPAVIQGDPCRFVPTTDRPII